ncbi:hypothetical protein ABZ348_31175 [Streptomyces sp. NPDC005963]|uniref:hypothetical protein n=1 Tax=Streptomyces sp. NPDC005963 TaxID=3156721 RepID=UPI0033F5A7D9
MGFSKTLTRSGKDGCVPIGVGFYYIDDNNARWSRLRNARCLTTPLPNGGRRSVFVDCDGRAVATAWFWNWD